MIPYNLINLKYSLIFGLLGVLSVGCNSGSSDSSTSNSVAGLFSKNEIAQSKTDSTFVLDYINKEPKFKEHKDLMFLFYGDRDYKLAWFDDNELVPQSEKLLSTIDHAPKEGLEPRNYRLVDFDAMFNKYKEMSPSDSARLKLQQEIDVALTATYFVYASDFYRGRVNPQNVSKVSWGVRNNKIKLHKALQTILKERESTYPYYEFEALHHGYVQLRDKLSEYRALQEKGGWPKVELGDRKLLQKGDTAKAVLALRKRLNPEQNFNANDKKLQVYDANLERQVKQFQMLHGLKQDGVVGGNTLSTMNIPLEERIDQIMINMERWRWIPKRMVPKKLDQKYIWVNIPEYKLYVYEDPNNDPEADRKYEKVLEMPVIVGKTMHSTPIFSDKLEYVVMAPYWNVPNSIVENEIKPKMLRNPGYLASQNMEVVTKEKNPQRVSEYDIDWASVTEQNFTYRVRQKPGPKNSLGQIKFLFPNEHAVYLHDTPADALFSQTQRDFSHGCVRVERPLDLAKYVLKDMPEWDENRIREAINGGEETWVTLPKQVQVYLVYFTAWVDESGQIHFREDLYGHDNKLEQEYFG
ncbi:L,D-transpeptidase family protein [Pontibacter harenae]|uniref:L,D-transpeptidase family protein n=1 Tax=Pontibacter harenae TaxID=2894083 RepID=UPI001E47A13D|nr:L,D-transpeptidase family protein [Pontibacter harenae]MCC9168824.1 L,D-transpeptidase family protein [Pontibacter harenae]